MRISPLYIFIASSMVIFTVFGFFMYNKTEIRAEEDSQSDSFEQEIVCENPEIPVGAAIDEAAALAKELLSNTQNALSSSLAQTILADKLPELSDDCKAGNCQTPCQQVPETKYCGGDTSNCSTVDDAACLPDAVSCESRYEDPMFPDVCTRYCTRLVCNTSPTCTGDPCPTMEIDAAIDAVIANDDTIRLAKEAVAALFNDDYASDMWRFCSDKTKLEFGLGNKRTDLIRCLTEESRKGLSNCVTPADFYGAEKAGEKIEILYSCQEGKYQRVFSKDQAECYTNNFFCCYLK